MSQRDPTLAQFREQLTGTKFIGAETRDLAISDLLIKASILIVANRRAHGFHRPAVIAPTANAIVNVAVQKEDSE